MIGLGRGLNSPSAAYTQVPTEEATTEEADLELAPTDINPPGQELVTDHACSSSENGKGQ